MKTKEVIEKERSEWLKLIPPLYHSKFIRAWKGIGFKAAVSAKCLDCTNCQRVEITNCTITNCPLWEIRPYQSGVDENETETD